MRKELQKFGTVEKLDVENGVFHILITGFSGKLKDTAAVFKIVSEHRGDAVLISSKGMKGICEIKLKW